MSDAATILSVLVLFTALPLVWFAGKRAGKATHYCVRIREAMDDAPTRYVMVPCPACGQEIRSALTLRPRYRNGQPVIDAEVDPTDMEHHTLAQHVERESA